MKPKVVATQVEAMWTENRLRKFVEPFTLDEADFVEVPNYIWDRVEGVYIFLFKGEIIYVGSTLSFGQRLASHVSQKLRFDRVFFLKTKSNSSIGIEKIFIHKLNPAFNIAGKPKHKKGMRDEQKANHNEAIDS